MTMANEPLADARDMFAAHTLFRREFGLMPGLVRAVAAGDTQRSTLVADHVTMVSGVLEGRPCLRWPAQQCPRHALGDRNQPQPSLSGCDRTELQTVRQAREAGLSWTDIATSLGVTRQAARERWHEVDGAARDESPGAMEVSSGA